MTVELSLFLFNRFVCMLFSVPTNISTIPIMALFITIRMLHGKGVVKTTPVHGMMNV